MKDASYKPKGPEEINRNMSAIRSKENRTEVALRKALFGMGFRYRKYSAKLPGYPDIIFSKQKVVVFVDGDFWHARKVRESTTSKPPNAMKTSNRDYWAKKFSRRIERDRQVNHQLSALGWRVLRFWESDLKSDLTAALSIISYNLKTR
jgi:DNA mismatch endonuclease (patch repair protein)